MKARPFLTTKKISLALNSNSFYTYPTLAQLIKGCQIVSSHSYSKVSLLHEFVYDREWLLEIQII